MNILQSLRMALKSIFSSKMRSFLTMLGIIIGVTAVIIMVSIVQGSNQKTKEYYESMGTNKISVYAYNWNGKSISQQLYDYCLGLEDLVLGVTPSMTYWPRNGLKYNTLSTSDRDRNNLQLYMGSDQFAICNNFTLEKGRDITYLDVKNYNQVIVLGSRVADYLFQYKNPIGEKVTLDGNTFEVIGVYAAKDPNSDWSMDDMAVVPYSMNRLLNKSTEMNEFTVKAKSASTTTEAITMITSFLSGIIDENSGYFNVYSENQWMYESNAQNLMMSLVLGGIAGISLLVGGIGIMNIMLVTVTERTKEIGIRKAIGASRASIITQFLIEAAVICSMGGIIGIALGYLGTLVAGKLIMNMVLLPSPVLTIGAVMFSVILGIAFGMYPAVKASGLQPVDALRAE